MSRPKLGFAPGPQARSSATLYASYDQLSYAPRGAGAAPVAGSSPPARGRAFLTADAAPAPRPPSLSAVRAAAGRARGFAGPPGVLGRLPGLRRRISVHGQIIDCRGVLTFVPGEPATFWLMYDVCAALAVMTGALLGLAT